MNLKIKKMEAKYLVVCDYTNGNVDIFDNPADSEKELEIYLKETYGKCEISYILTNNIKRY